MSLLSSAAFSFSPDHMQELANSFETIQHDIGGIGAELEDLDATLYNSTQRGFLAALAMVDLSSRISEFQSAAQLLKSNATTLQEGNVEGALSLTQQARERAQKAQERVELTQQPVSDSERQRRRTEALLTREGPQLSQSPQKNTEDLTELGARLEVMEQSLPQLNNQVHRSSFIRSFSLHTFTSVFNRSSQLLVTVDIIPNGAINGLVG